VAVASLNSSISVLVVDLTIVAAGLSRLIEEQADLTVVGMATTAGAALHETQQRRPDVVTVADVLPDGPGALAAARIIRARPETHVVLTTNDAVESLLTDATAAGCSAVISMAQPVDDLLAAIRAAAQDPSAMPLDPAAEVQAHGLSDRELQVLTLLARGMDTEAISAELFLSINTVRNHVQHILVKLGVHSRLAAVALAVRQGMVSIS
jgi:DNA-binding NarL/FixJ family response regulator